MSQSTDDKANTLSPGAFALLREALDDVRGIYSLYFRTLYYVVRGKRTRGAVAEQMYAIGNRSIFFMSVTMGFIGAIITFQSGTQAMKIIPDMSLLGPTYIKLLVRDLAASLGALPLATRVGAGIAAEIGSMVVTEQVDALRMSAAEPVDYLVVPRFLACVIMGSCVLVWSGGVALLVGIVTARVIFDVSPHTFFNLTLLTTGDVVVGIFKCFVYGGAIAIVSSHYGLKTFGGSEGVGWATTSAVVGSCFAVILLNLFISGVAFLIFPS